MRQWRRKSSLIAPVIRVECREHWLREWVVGDVVKEERIATGWSTICSGSSSCAGGAAG